MNDGEARRLGWARSQIADPYHYRGLELGIYTDWLAERIVEDAQRMMSFPASTEVIQAKLETKSPWIGADQ